MCWQDKPIFLPPTCADYRESAQQEDQKVACQGFTLFVLKKLIGLRHFGIGKTLASNDADHRSIAWATNASLKTRTRSSKYGQSSCLSFAALIRG
ncbi:MAG TPA: hypothetical protein VEG25_06745 [Burkholderiales bacterium]|nr:hypothetical protein [Burkholderiales bacterium]